MSDIGVIEEVGKAAEKAKLLEWALKGVFSPGRPAQEVIECTIFHVGIRS